MKSRTISILYIGGWGRSGSTLVGSKLEQIDGCSHVGEIWHLWNDFLDGKAMCSCRNTYEDCDFWGEVFVKAGLTRDVVQELKMIKNQYLGSKNLLLKRSAWNDELPSDLLTYTKYLGALYRAIAEITGSNCLIDASKTPTMIRILAELGQQKDLNINPRVLHLIRDPRAVAYSWWFRQKARGPEENHGKMARHSPIRSTMSWRMRNRYVEKICQNWDVPRLEMRYEDFATSPDVELQKILEWCEIGEQIITEPSASGPIHSVRGNPIRFEDTNRPIKLDEGWRQGMPRYWRRAVSITAGSDLARYGYQKE